MEEKIKAKIKELNRKATALAAAKVNLVNQVKQIDFDITRAVASIETLSSLLDNSKTVIVDGVE